MKFGLKVGHLSDYDSLLQSGRISSYKTEYGVFGAPLPPLAEDLLKNMREKIGDENDIPIGWYGSGGHESVGILFLPFSRDMIENPPFVRGGVIGRVSFGPAKSGRHPEDNERWLTDQMGRYHIGVHAQRIFYPAEDIDTASRMNAHSPMGNTVNFSMKWGEDEFRDFNSGEKVHSTRSSYLESAWKIHQSLKEDMTAEELVGAVGRRRNLIPLSELRDGGFHSVPKTVPTVGYRPVLEFLERYGPVSPSDGDRLPGMSKVEASRYLVEKVLPAMQNFVKQ
jgi:hypothetical protein